MPISPEEVDKTKVIPPFVFDAVDEIIIKHYANGVARFTVSEVRDELRARANTRGMDFQSWWLDFEDAYRAVGWIVAFDKSGYNEPGPDFYEFRKPQ